MRYSTQKLELVPDTLWAIVPENFFWFKLAPHPVKFNFFDIFANSKAFYTILN